MGNKMLEKVQVNDLSAIPSSWLPNKLLAEFISATLTLVEFILCFLAIM